MNLHACPKYGHFSLHLGSHITIVKWLASSVCSGVTRVILNLRSDLSFFTGRIQGLYGVLGGSEVRGVLRRQLGLFEGCSSCFYCVCVFSSRITVAVSYVVYGMCGCFDHASIVRTRFSYV